MQELTTVPRVTPFEATFLEGESELGEQNTLLKKQNDLVKKILDSSIDAIVVYDTDTRIISINQASLKIFGGKAEEVIGKKLLDVLPELRDTKGYHDLLRAIKGETIHNEIYRSPIADRYFENSIVPLKDENDKVYAVLAVAHDNTDLIANAEALQQKNKELNEAQNLALLGSWEWDVENDKLSWSETLYNIYEIAPSEGMSFEKFNSLVHPADKSNVEKSIASAYKNKRFEEFFHRIITPSGTVKTLHARGEVISDQYGNVIKMIGTGQDVTSQLQLVEQLKKLSESDQLKSDFIRMASHELKTPITSIKGYLQLLLTVMKETEQNKLSPLLLKSSLISIEKQVDKLTRLLSELLDLSRIESGQLTLNGEEFNFNGLVIDAIQDVLYTQPKHTINLYHDYYSTVYADKDRISQIIINLLNNAIKYSPNSTKIDVTIHQPNKDHIALSIRDYGIGIDKKHQERIFDRFYRAEGESEQTYPGFGIGLFIASEIIQRHDGSISLTSEKGEGSVFTFTLPLESTKQTT